MILKNKFKVLLLIWGLSLSLILGGCSNQQNSGTVSSQNISQHSDNSIPNNSEKATVEKVTDGDTMKLKLVSSEEVITVRLLLIDTPESVKPGVSPQPYSIEASNFAKEILGIGDTVYIEYDSGSKTDKYGRHLGYLWFYSKKDNQWEMYNEKVVEKGLARVGYIYSQRKHLNLLYDAQDIAKKNKLNIWSVSGYVTDKGFDVEAYNENNSSTKNSYNQENESSSTDTVYANGGASSSKKYHSSKDAHGMKGAIKMTEKQAKKAGYQACKICY